MLAFRLLCRTFHHDDWIPVTVTMATEKPRLLDLFEGKQGQKLILVISVITILVLEVLIYLGAASQAGEKSRVVITNTQGQKIYETPGNTLTSYERMVFENTFGPLNKYQIHIDTEQMPFPFRAWVSAAVGIPVGLILLLGFAVKAFLALLHGSDGETHEADALSMGAGRVGSLFTLLRNVSVFHVGLFILAGVLLFWMVPNFLGQFAVVSLATIKDYQWFFVGVAVFLGILILWVIYLRYRLSKKMIENQLDLEKFRVEQHLLTQGQSPALLTQGGEQAGNEGQAG